MIAPQPKLDIIVIGAGIAGLCSAIGLAQKGHNVTILESAHELAPVGIGLHIPPNATLVLKQFGLLEKLEKDALQPTSFTFRHGKDNSVIVKFPAGQNRAGSPPYWSMRRSHYQRNLYEAAVEAGVKVRLSARVDNLDLDAPAVTLVSGEIINADLIVVANGVKSRLRNLVVPEHEVSIALNAMSSYRAYVDKSDLLKDPITAPFFKKTGTNVWVDYAHHVIVYPCGGDLYTVSATYPATSDEVEGMEWTRSAESEEAVSTLRDFDPVVRQIFSHAKEIKKFRLAEVPRLPRWTSKSGKVALVGDAAHAMLPFLASGAAMATEDAAAIAECVARVKNADDIPVAMKAYERARKWRAEVVQAQSRRAGDMIHMPDGEEQENRDRKMAGLPQAGVWEADAGPMMDPVFREFLYDHNVVEHTRKVLDSMDL